jgi:hypothetical protein
MTDITFPYWGPLVTKAALDVQTMSTLSEKMHTAKDYFHHDITSLENEFNFNKEEIDNVNLLLQPYFESYDHSLALTHGLTINNKESGDHRTFIVTVMHRL